MIDFLIYYEHKVRELEYITLLKIELENRGYTVELCYTGIPFLMRRKRYHNKVRVVLVMAMYRDYDLYRQVYAVTGLTTKIVNLQWEQVYTNEIQCAYNTPHYPRGNAQKVLHLCWGDAGYKNLQEAGVNANKIFVAGPLHMDLLFSPLVSFYKSKQEIINQFGLISGMPTIIFISSFACADMSDRQKQDLKWCFKDEQLEYLEWINARSKSMLIDWFIWFLSEHPNYNFIYRPHPGELEDSSLHELQKRFSNFKVINEYSVKQWILISDKVLTWMSTSAVDAFFAGVSCAVLRPLDVKPEKDMTIFNNSTFICSYDGFENFILNRQNGSLDPVVVKSYYDVDQDKRSYVKICEILENVFSADKFDFIWDRQTKKEFRKRLNKDIIVETFKMIIRPLLYRLYEIIDINKIRTSPVLEERMVMYHKVKAQRSRDFATDLECEDVYKRLKIIIG